MKEKPLPKLRPRWALVRVRLAGICNTDTDVVRGYHDLRGTPGHEFVGEVEEVRGVSARERARWLGHRVVGEINVACSAYGYRPACVFCRRRLKPHCTRRTVLGIVAHDGAFAEYLALPLENLHVVPDSVSDEQAVFVEPLAAACEILEQINIEKFREAAVVGDGKLAQLVARVLRTRLSRVVMYGKHEKKLALARVVGVQAKRVHGNAGDVKRIRESYGLVVEATQAAPKPLWMFTTVTWDAQLFSIPRRAAPPPKLAPYPMLVGTAITGTPTSPPTTLGSAPSIPATQTITRADASFSRCSSRR